MMVAARAGMMLFRFHRGRPFVGVLLLLLILVLVVLGVVLIVRLVRRPDRPGAASWVPGPSPSPPSGQLDPVYSELRMRYARGEIGRDEFLQRAADLGYGAAPAGAPPGPAGPPTASVGGGRPS